MELTQSMLSRVFKGVLLNYAVPLNKDYTLNKQYLTKAALALYDFKQEGNHEVEVFEH